MKIRDSGMPDERTWAQFFEAHRVLRLLGLSERDDVVDFGCGYGTFSIAAAQLTRGRVLAFDIDPQMVAMTAEKAHEMGLSNVSASERDFVSTGTALSIRPRPEQCIDWATQTGFASDGNVIALPPYHYGIVARKPVTPA